MVAIVQRFSGKGLPAGFFIKLLMNLFCDLSDILPTKQTDLIPVGTVKNLTPNLRDLLLRKKVEDISCLLMH